ncbi:glycosyltransferase family 2 protein [Rhodopila sp.]|uniref:glycosyltransferase family 2 protein n=1 Tax=Rhodopila sp. TaxID=2480087 RepID=UPI003D10A9C4
MSSFTLDLERARHATSPRYAPPPTPLRAVLIHGGITLLWVLLFLRAFGAETVFAWSIGVAYIAYDTALLLFVFVQTLPLVRRAKRAAPRGQDAPGQHQPRTLGVIIAAHNEAAVLPQTLAALFDQTPPPEAIVIADDGSTDATADLLARLYQLQPPALGEISAASPHHPSLRWLRLPHQGKARALNAALESIGTDLVMTVDADTLLDPGAAAAMRHAFSADPSLVAATGVLFPVCSATAGGHLLQWFQTYEYMRNFLSRYAWARQDGLLLISGAFAAYRRQPVLAVGGFDTDCLVEDYELSHRLLNHAAAHALGWRTDVIGAARALTDAPSTIGAFLRQRRRWFGGFLQTQLWYRHMIGAPGYGRLGTRMLPVKAFDTMQPLYGLTSIILLIGYALTGRDTVVNPVAGIIGGKIALDLLFYLWSIVLYRHWVGPRARVNIGWAVLAALIEPFSFQLLRHSGAALGWVTFITGQHRWDPRKPNKFVP